MAFWPQLEVRATFVFGAESECESLTRGACWLNDERGDACVAGCRGTLSKARHPGWRGTEMDAAVKGTEQRAAAARECVCITMLDPRTLEPSINMRRALLTCDPRVFTHWKPVAVRHQRKSTRWGLKHFYEFSKTSRSIQSPNEFFWCDYENPNHKSTATLIGVYF